MKRLTIKTPEGPALDMNNTYPSEEAAREDLMQKFRVAVNRLSDYEDTGLTPGEISDLKETWDMYGGSYGITSMLEKMETVPTNNPSPWRSCGGWRGAKARYGVAIQMEFMLGCCVSGMNGVLLSERRISGCWTKKDTAGFIQ